MNACINRRFCISGSFKNDRPSVFKRVRHSDRQERMKTKKTIPAIPSPVLPSGCEPLLTKDQLAVMLGIKPRTVAKWALAGKLPTLRVGCLLRFKWADVEAALRQGGNGGAQ